MTAPRQFLLYGATGYTGGLIAREAARRGLRPLLAGRDARRVKALADDLGLDWVCASLDEAGPLEAALQTVALVLHCAGPFSHTARPMLSACLRTTTHYVDITGEMAVIEALAARDGEARRAGIMVLPAAGFDVVPSDCLALHLKRRLPTATRLALGFQTIGTRPSRGTARSVVENAGGTAIVRRGGAVVEVPLGWRRRAINFGHGPITALTVPAADVITAFHTTGIPDIDVYLAAGPRERLLLGAARRLRPVLRLPATRETLKWAIRFMPPGPSADQRVHGISQVWGEVEDAEGRRAVSRLRGPEGYSFTVLTALAIVEKILAGHALAGFQTPGRVFGPDLVTEIPGVARTDAEGAASG